MQDIFNKLGESIKTTFKEATGQTQKTVDQTIYRTEILTLKNELKKAYQEIGIAEYEAHILEQEHGTNQVLYNRVESLLKQIQEIEEEINTIVDIQKDSFDSYKREVKTKWNETMAKEKHPQKGEDGVEVMKFCSHCNAGNAVEANYCISCGKQF